MMILSYSLVIKHLREKMTVLLDKALILL